MADQITLTLGIEDVTLQVTEDSITATVNEPEQVTASITDKGPKGDTGAPGIDWQGDWDNATAYVINDAVFHDGSAWICIQDNTSQTPSESLPGSNYWELLSKKGAGLTFKGAWNVATAYVVDDVVEEEGTAYVCILAHTGQQPPNATYWEILVSKGDPGAPANWTGPWSNSTPYVIGDAVEEDGGSYVCILGHTNQQPPNATYWGVIAEKGGQGDKGNEWQGAWDSGTAYVVDDVAEDGGSSYICILGHTNQQPPNATYWEIFAEKGDAGADAEPYFMCLKSGANANINQPMTAGVPLTKMVWNTTPKSENNPSGAYFTAQTDGIEVLKDGLYLIEIEVSAQATVARAGTALEYSVTGSLSVNDSPRDTLYIRNNDGHETDKVAIWERVELEAGDEVHAVTGYDSGQPTGTVSAPTGKSRLSVTLLKEL